MKTEARVPPQPYGPPAKFFSRKGNKKRLELVVVDAVDGRSPEAVRNAWKELGKSDDKGAWGPCSPDHNQKKGVFKKGGVDQLTRNRKDLDPGRKEVLDAMTALSVSLLGKYGLATREPRERYLMEAHRYEMTGGRPPRAFFARHRDDDANLNWKVDSLIFYIDISEKLKGSSFRFFIPAAEAPLLDEDMKRMGITRERSNSFMHLFTTRWDTIAYTVPVKPGRAILMRGDVEHEPELPTRGSLGCRDSLVVLLGKKKPAY